MWLFIGRAHKYFNEYFKNPSYLLQDLKDAFSLLLNF